MANLSPSELASLLGPAECVAAVAPEESQCWRRFTDEFVRIMTARLRPLVRAASRVQLIGNATLSAASVIANHDSHSIVGFWQSNRSLESLSIILSPSLVTTFVDRLLGGRSAPHMDDPVEHRPLSDIDHRLAARLIETTRQCVVEIANVEPSFDLNDIPQQTTSFEEAWLPDCSLLRLTFELRFVQGGGSLDLLIPLEVAAEFANKEIAAVNATQSSNGNHGTVDRRESRSSPRRMTVVARLAQITLPASDLKSLEVGDVLLTDAGPDESLDVVVNNAVLFRGQSGLLDGRKAVRLLAPVSER